MTTNFEEKHWRTVVIGGGQAGLAVGRSLAGQGDDFVILDASERVGDAWRTRWASLRLFTPAEHDGLPGVPFPAPAGTSPTKDELADYIAAYAERFDLPVRSGVRVLRLDRAGSGYRLLTTEGELTADRVVLATGTHPSPRRPRFADELAPEIRQLHSFDYRSPDAIGPGKVLVVGAGTSGVQIALDLAESHATSIAGRPTPQIPELLLRHLGGLFWWFISHVLTVRTPMGRKARGEVRGSGGPLIHVPAGELDRAGVARLPRVAGVQDGRPVLEDGRVLDVDTVIWATGFQPDFSWISFPVTDDSGWPAGDRGVSSLAPGLYFVGMPFQFGLTSGLVGGVGRDAAFVAEHLGRAESGPPPGLR